jgi:hypothetical protein
MRMFAAMLFLGLCGCHQRDADPSAILNCMRSTHSNDAYLLSTECEPLGKSERIAGTWFVGFELSRFKEGRPSEGDRMFQYHELIVPAALDTAVHKNDAGAITSYDLVFVGRRSLLHLDSEPNTFVLDKLVSIRRAQVQLPALR